MSSTSRMAPRAYLLAAVLTLAWVGVWSWLFAAGRSALDSAAVRLMILVTPLLISAGWLLAGRLKLFGRRNEIPRHVADMALIDDLNRAEPR